MRTGVNTRPRQLHALRGDQVLAAGGEWPQVVDARRALLEFARQCAGSSHHSLFVFFFSFFFFIRVDARRA